jgi:hypothetical protein
LEKIELRKIPFGGKFIPFRPGLGNELKSQLGIVLAATEFLDFKHMSTDLGVFKQV